MRPAIEVIRDHFPNVKKVVDADRAVEVTVQPMDVKGAQKKDPENCALARACKRGLALDGALVSMSVAYLVKGKTAVRYLMPRTVEREIVSFDRGGGMAPGNYRLVPSGPATALGANRRAYSAQDGSRKKNPKLVRMRTTGIRQKLY